MATVEVQSQEGISAPANLDWEPYHPDNNIGEYKLNFTWNPPVRPIGIGDNANLKYRFTLHEGTKDGPEGTCIASQNGDKVY